MKQTTFRICLGVMALLLCWSVGDAQVTASIPKGLGLSAKDAPDPTRISYLHVLSTGQSLSTGYLASPSLSTTQPYGNLSLYGGPGGFGPPLVPLVEMGGEESPSSGIANSLFAWDPGARPVVIGLHGVPGWPYASLKKGTQMWDNAMQQVAITQSELHALDSTAPYVPLAVTVIHGETDFLNGNSAQYQGYLEEWQEDYETDVSAIVGRAVDLPMFVSQMTSGTAPDMGLAQWAAHQANPGKIIMVGPKYQYGLQIDHVHLQNVESKHVGEMFAKVMKEVLFKGQTWNPLMPIKAVRSGSVVTVSYHIPAGTLAFDTTLVAKRPNFGFEFLQTGGNAVSIIDVALIHNDERVQITLDGVPTGSDQRIRYACNCYHGGLSSTWCGDALDSSAVGGNLRDTDTTVSPAIGSTGLPLYDWSIQFELPITEHWVGVATSSPPAMTIFPNPAHESMRLRVSGGYPVESVALHDLAGRKVLDMRIPDGVSEVDIPLQALPRGLYLLTAKLQGAPDITAKVIVE